MASTSTFSYIGFLCNGEINAPPLTDEPVPIPDHLRAILNKYWNEGKFIGDPRTDIMSLSISSVSFRVLKQTPAQRIEQVTWKPLTSHEFWQRTNTGAGS